MIDFHLFSFQNSQYCHKVFYLILESKRENGKFSPNTSDLSVSVSQVCYKCEQPGHFARECPNGGDDFRGKTGHFHSSQEPSQACVDTNWISG